MAPPLLKTLAPLLLPLFRSATQEVPAASPSGLHGAAQATGTIWHWFYFNLTSQEAKIHLNARSLICPVVAVLDYYTALEFALECAPAPPTVRPPFHPLACQGRASFAPGGRAAASSDLYRLVTKYQPRQRNIGQAKLKH